LDFEVKDYYAACVLPAKLMAMTVLDLLSNNGEKAEGILKDFTPLLTREQYINLLEKYFN